MSSESRPDKTWVTVGTTLPCSSRPSTMRSGWRPCSTSSASMLAARSRMSSTLHPAGTSRGRARPSCWVKARKKLAVSLRPSSMDTRKNVRTSASGAHRRSSKRRSNKAARADFPSPASLSSKTNSPGRMVSRSSIVSSRPTNSATKKLRRWAMERRYDPLGTLSRLATLRDASALASSVSSADAAKRRHWSPSLADFALSSAVLTSWGAY